jgi:hypothetical protein
MTKPVLTTFFNCRKEGSSSSGKTLDLALPSIRRVTKQNWITAHLRPRDSERTEARLHNPICLQFVLLNSCGKGITSPFTCILHHVTILHKIFLSMVSAIKCSSCNFIGAAVQNLNWTNNDTLWLYGCMNLYSVVFLISIRVLIQTSPITMRRDSTSNAISLRFNFCTRANLN